MQLTPKEKAQELLHKMENIALKHDCFGAEYLVAKECALIAVDEILNICPLANRDYWLEVRNELLNN